MGTMKQKILLIAILLLGSVLRLYKISSIPPGANWDESAVGFNAHLITQSGRDEWGQKYPLSFRSFDDYKAPAQTYLVASSVKLFGVNEFAVRFPSALAGIITVLFTYLLAKKLFPETRRSSLVALLSALLLAITPWSIHFSRAAFEANIALLFILIALIFFQNWLKKPQLVWLLLTSLFFLLTSSTYHSYKLITPLIIIALGIIHYRPVIRFYKQIIPIGIIFAIAFFILNLSPQVLERASQVNSFTDPDLIKTQIQFSIENQANNFPEIINKLFFNRRWIYLRIFIDQYLIHFHPNFLFFGQTIFDQYHVPENGFLLYWSAPFLIYGLYLLIKNKPHFWLLIISLLILAPLPAALTTDAPQPFRAQLMLIPLTLITAYGLQYFLKKKKTILLSIACCLLTINLTYYLYHYFIIMPREQSLEWQVGYRQLSQYIKIHPEYRQIVILTRHNQAIPTNLEKAHAFLAFYLLPSSNEYFSSGGTKLCQFGTTGNMHFDNLNFFSLDCLGRPLSKSDITSQVNLDLPTLFVHDPHDLEAINQNIKLSLSPIDNIKDINDIPMFTLSTINTY